MVVAESMKRKVITVSASATVADAVSLFNEHHVGMLPVLDQDRRLVGILNLRDLLDLIMPAFVHLIDHFEYVTDFGVLEDREPPEDTFGLPIAAVMEQPVSVTASSGLLRAFAILHRHELLDLPVVDEDGRLVGLASRVDVGRALLAGWRLDEAKGTS